MTYQYKMADICLHLNTPFEINIGKESLEFLSENLDTPAHEIITFQPVDLLDYEENDGHWEAFRWYTQDDVNDYVYHWYYCKRLWYRNGNAYCPECDDNYTVDYSRLTPHPTFIQGSDGYYYCPDCNMRYQGEPTP